MDKHPTLVGQCINHNDKMLPQVKHYFFHLLHSPISQNIPLHWAGKTFQGQTLQLNWPIRKLQRKKIMNTGPDVTSLHFLLNLLINPIRQNVPLQYAGKTCQGQTLLLRWAIHKLQKNKIMNTGPGVIFTTLFIFHLRFVPISQTVPLYQAGKTCNGQTPYLSWAMRESQ